MSFTYKSAAYRRLFERLADEALDVAWGANRIVLMFPRHVYKLPLTKLGAAANEKEARWSAAHGKTGVPPHIADCHLERLDGLEVLWMEYVEPLSEPMVLPEWALAVDDIQVGHDVDDRLVAYDL